jgi:hypothetical protein
MNERKSARTPSSSASGRDEQWLLDPRDVRRHERLARERERKSPVAKLARYLPIALAAAGAFIVFWNFETLREATVDFSALTSLFESDDSATGAAAPRGDAFETVSVEAPAVVGTETSTTRGDGPTASASAPVGASSAPSLAAGNQELRSGESAPVSTVAPEPAAPAEAPASAPPALPATPPTPEIFAFGVTVNSASEGDAAAAVLVVRNGGNRGISSIKWWTSEGSATAGVDYADLGEVTERFAAGQQNRTIRIPIVGDRVVEGPETFYVHIAPSEGSVVSSERAQTEVVINDDD